LARVSDIEAASCIADIKIGRFVMKEVTEEKIILIYYFTHDDDQSMTFEIFQTEELLLDYSSYKKISRVKLINVKL
jgi:hypothetical protein